MKKSLVLSGFFSFFMISMSMLVRFMKWPGVEYITFAGFCTLALLVAPLVLMISLKSKSKVLGIISSVSFFLTGVGMMFKVMHWPSANIQLVLGFVIFCFGVLPLVFISLYKKQSITA